MAGEEPEDAMTVFTNALERAAIEDVVPFPTTTELTPTQKANVDKKIRDCAEALYKMVHHEQEFSTSFGPGVIRLSK